MSDDVQRLGDLNRLTLFLRQETHALGDALDLHDVLGDSCVGRSLVEEPAGWLAIDLLQFRTG